MKKGFALIVVLILIVGSVAVAEDVETNEQDVLTPADITYRTGRLVEDAQYGLSRDYVEKAGQQNEFAERRMAALHRDESREHIESLPRNRRTRRKAIPSIGSTCRK